MSIVSIEGSARLTKIMTARRNGAHSQGSKFSVCSTPAFSHLCHEGNSICAVSREEDVRVDGLTLSGLAGDLYTALQRTVLARVGGELPPPGLEW